jgi:5-methylcytosine-specific restriction endonuclease McrBC GTP-binding regulatory subunit McrB
LNHLVTAGRRLSQTANKRLVEPQTEEENEEEEEKRKKEKDKEEKEEEKKKEEEVLTANIYTA